MVLLDFANKCKFYRNQYIILRTAKFRSNYLRYLSLYFYSIRLITEQVMQIQTLIGVHMRIDTPLNADSGNKSLLLSRCLWADSTLKLLHIKHSILNLHAMWRNPRDLRQTEHSESSDSGTNSKRDNGEVRDSHTICDIINLLTPT